MKKYIRAILIGSALLLLFPFLGLPELWEHLFVVIIGFIIGTTTLLLRHKSGLVEHDDDEQSLQNYVTELQTRFREQKHHITPKKTPIETVTSQKEEMPTSYE